MQKSKHQRLDIFNLWCWGRLLRVPWTARRSNQSILKEINPEYSLEGLMLKLKLQYFSHLMWRADSLKRTLMLGKIEGRRRRKQQRIRWLDGITIVNGHGFEQAVGDGEGQGSLAAAVHGVTKSWTRLRHWTTTTMRKSFHIVAERDISKDPDIASELRIWNAHSRTLKQKINL